MTAKAPPPEDSQLTDRYSALACVSARISTSCRGKAAAYLASRRSPYLYQVRVPGISADAQVIVAKLLLGGLAKDVS